MLGGSKYTARWGYSLDITLVWTFIPPCSDCEILLHDDCGSSHCIDTCTRCVYWDTGRDSILLHYEPPKNYPEEALPPSGKLPPLKITYEQLKSAALLSHQQFINGSWSKSNVESFLKANGLNNNAISGILTCAGNSKELAELEKNCTKQHNASMQARYEEIIQEKQRKPTLYDKWSMPALWDRGVQLEQHVDVVMHLLFLGVVRCTLELVQVWSKRRGKNAAFQ